MTHHIKPSGDYGFGQEAPRKSSSASSPKKVDGVSLNKQSLKAQRKVATTEPSHVEGKAVSHRRSGAEVHRA